MIGRPGIGGEFLEVYPTTFGRYVIRRFRRANSQRDDPRSLKVADLPAEAMISDLLSTIERIVEHADAQLDHGVDLDDRFPDGKRPSIRDRLRALASK